MQLSSRSQSGRMYPFHGWFAKLLRPCSLWIRRTLPGQRSMRRPGPHVGPYHALFAGPTYAVFLGYNRSSQRSTPSPPTVRRTPPWCSAIIRTARSRTSGAYLLALPIMTPIFSSNGVSGKPGAVQTDFRLSLIDTNRIPAIGNSVRHNNSHRRGISLPLTKTS